jgi:hypothetical protein
MVDLIESVDDAVSEAQDTVDDAVTTAEETVDSAKSSVTTFVDSDTVDTATDIKDGAELVESVISGDPAATGEGIAETFGDTDSSSEDGAAKTKTDDSKETVPSDIPLVSDDSSGSSTETEVDDETNETTLADNDPEKTKSDSEVNQTPASSSSTETMSAGAGLLDDLGPAAIGAGLVALIGGGWYLTREG